MPPFSVAVHRRRETGRLANLRSIAYPRCAGMQAVKKFCFLTGLTASCRKSCGPAFGKKHRETAQTGRSVPPANQAEPERTSGRPRPSEPSRGFLRVTGFDPRPADFRAAKPAKTGKPYGFHPFRRARRRSRMDGHKLRLLTIPVVSTDRLPALRPLCMRALPQRQAQRHFHTAKGLWRRTQ